MMMNQSEPKFKLNINKDLMKNYIQRNDSYGIFKHQNDSRKTSETQSLVKNQSWYDEHTNMECIRPEIDADSDLYPKEPVEPDSTCNIEV